MFSSIKAQTIDAKYFNAMKWRMIGPYRGGRTVGAAGVPQQSGTFYIGVNNSGVWKTNDYGRTWFPISDDQPTGSIGDVAVAASNPNTIYVGSGEGLLRPDLSVGDGMYKSTDAGKTWIYLGLNDIQQIGGLAIDQTNENRVFVAALGHPYGSNAQRGIFRTIHVQLTISDIQGNKYYNKKMEGGELYKISVSNLQNGLYLLNIRNDKINLNKKLVIAR